MALFSNCYYERKVGTPRACYICRMPTDVVLATIDQVDFIYVCAKHLGDPGFATQLVAPTPTTPTPSEADISAAVSAHAAKEARKAEKAKATSSTDSKDTSDTGKKKAPPPPPAPLGLPPPALTAGGSPTAPTGTKDKERHRKYELHRSMFAMRQREVKGRKQAVQAREVGRGLPQVPRGAFGS